MSVDVLHSTFGRNLLCAVASVGFMMSAAPGGFAEAAVPEVRIESEIVRIPIEEANDVRFVRLARSRGLSQQRVTHIVQDDQGFMWFGTQYGLNRYDGYRFKTFAHNVDDSSSLCGVYITSIFKDRTGALWIGCDYSVGRYDPETESFVHYRLNPTVPIDRASAVRHISQDQSGMLWLSTGNGLYRLNPEIGEVTRFHHDADVPESLGSNDVKFAQEDRRGHFWVATGLGLEEFDRATGLVTLRIPLQEPRELGFFEDSSDTFWIHWASGNGLAIYDRDTRILTPFSFREVDPKGFPLTGVSSMIEDENGTLWVGTFSDGLLQFDKRRQQFIRYRNDPSDHQSLTENRITTLYGDREGNIWVGFGATEPVFFPTRPQSFTALPFDAENAANLGERLVNAIHQDQDGIVWLGTTGALNRIDRGKGTIDGFEVPGNGVASDVLAITRDHAGYLWVGTSGQGLYRLDETTGEIRSFRHQRGDSTSLSDDTVIDVLAGNATEIWVATQNGLSRFNPETDRFRVYGSVANGLPPFYSSLALDSKGHLWLASYGAGLSRFDPKTERFEILGSESDSDRRLNDDRINSIFVDREDAVWVATQNGLNRFDPVTHDVETYLEKDGLASNAVSCILQDASGGIWVGTSNGLSRLNRQTRSFQTYTQADGLPGPDLSGWSACYRGVDGEMFFGGFSGAVAFFPDRLRETPFLPPIVLTEFQLFGAPVGREDGSPLARSIGDTQQLTLTHRQNSFSFEFSALSFRSPETNRYRYIMENLETDWREVGSDRRFASYTTVAPGTYRFRVQGATSRGPWNEPGLVLDLTITPPWWGTWWFRALVCAIVISLIVAGYAYRVRQLSHQFALQLDARVSERTRIARDLHDSLLQGFQGLMFRLQAVRNMLPGRADAAAAALEAAMDRSDVAIAEWRRAVENLRVSPLLDADLSDALAALGTELTGSSNQPAPSYHVIVEGRPKDLAPLVRDEIYRIAREAFRNAVRHAQAKHIEAEIEYGEAALRLRIRDDGLGMDKDVLRAGRREGHWGLAGMRERAAGLNGRFEVWSEAGAGTEVELQVPAGVAYGKRGFASRTQRE